MPKRGQKVLKLTVLSKTTDLKISRLFKLFKSRSKLFQNTQGVAWEHKGLKKKIKKC
jgi:hypothetical protein